jgi:hypothetical protein
MQRVKNIVRTYILPAWRGCRQILRVSGDDPKTRRAVREKTNMPTSTGQVHIMGTIAQNRTGKRNVGSYLAAEGTRVGGVGSRARGASTLKPDPAHVAGALLVLGLLTILD